MDDTTTVRRKTPPPAPRRKGPPPAPAATWTERERGAWVVPPPMLPSQWAERHRVLFRSNIPGPWRNDNAPYLRGIMDIACRPGVVQVNVQKAGQIGGSEAVRNLLAYWAHMDPDPVGLTLPDRDKGRKIVKTDIRPLFRRTPALRELIASEARDTLIESIGLLNGYQLDLMWSGSPTSMASNPYRRVINDEVDKFAPWTGREPDAVAATQVRLTTYGDRRLQVNISTPTTTAGRISLLYRDSTVQLQYRVPCPHCQTYQVLRWQQLKWEHPAEIKGRTELADWLAPRRDEAVWYECETCKRRIYNREKSAMVRAGQWTAATGHVADWRGEQLPDAERVQRWPPETRIGFQISALYCTWIHWGTLAGEWLRAQEDPEALFFFITNRLGEPFEFRLKTVLPTFFAAKRGRASLEAGIVPSWAWLLIATVDTQPDHFYAVVRAWGAGLRSQRVWHGKLMTFDELDKLVFATSWPSEIRGEAPMTIARALIDSGGTADRFLEASRTQQVYEYVLPRQSVIWAIKGDSKRGEHLYRPMANPMRQAGAKAEQAAGLRAYLVNTHRCNDLLADLMTRGLPRKDADGKDVPPTEPERWALNRQADEEYESHMAAVQKTLDPRSREEIWTPRTMHARHDYRDCEAYQIAAAYLCQVHLLPDQESLDAWREARRQQAQDREDEPAEAETRRDGGGWAAPL